MRRDLGDLGDEALVALARSGSAGAFATIYERHVGRVARALASFAGPDRELLDDLIQDVFLRVANGLPAYAPSHAFAQWLYTVALNVGRNHARRRARVVPMDPARFDDIAAARDPTAQVVAASDLMRLVALLPVPMREVVALRIGADMPYGEIAEMLGIPEGTARSRMHAAVRLLRDRTGAVASKKEQS